MPTVTPLSNEVHATLTIDNRLSKEYGDNVNRVLVFSSEFDAAHKEYPILFYKNEDNTYQSHAILGFEYDENLFLTDDGWQGRYIPAVLARGPFLIGFQEKEMDGQSLKQPVIHIDESHPRVGVEDGKRVFLPYGGDSPYLENVIHSLQLIHQGQVFDKTLFSCLEKFELLEPVSIDISLSNEEQFRLSHYYTINEDKLTGLSPEDLAELNRLGVLKLAYFAISSLENMTRLIDIKNTQSAMS